MKHLLIIFSVFISASIFAIKSPHGVGMKMECEACHTVDDWKTIKLKGFNHNKTRFTLEGQHRIIQCKQCHPTLIFAQNKVKKDCNACHKDVHQATVGFDCKRCHSSNSWLIPNARRMHQQIGFALVGAHAVADCYRCHQSASLLRFENIRKDCFGCHAKEYNATTKPNHRSAGFDTDCNRCHTQTGKDWSDAGKGTTHGFFPINGGHAQVKCESCHYDGYNAKLSSECSSCHSLNAKELKAFPAHGTKYRGYNCTNCHTIQAWSNARFKQHDGWFQIYSGKHKGKWQRCTDCHNNDATYKANCRKCHDFDS